jgi:peptide/nickel transport system substrate-binding protein
VNKAKALLKEAGYKDVNGDGFVEDPQGKPYVLKLDYPTGNPVRERSAPIIAADLKKAGIHVELAQPPEMTSHFNHVQQGKSEMFLAGWSLTPDPDPRGIWQSNDAFNTIKYKNPESDRLIQAAVQSDEAFTQEGRKKLYMKWTDLISKEVPQVFLYGQKNIDAYNRRIKGVTSDWRGIVVEDCIHWYIEKEKK